MATPADVTTLSPSATLQVNKELSSSEKIIETLTLQGVSDEHLKAIIELDLIVKVARSNEGGVEHVTITQILGDQESSEKLVLDGKEATIDDKLLGKVTGTTIRESVDKLRPEFSDARWTEDTKKNGVILTIARGHRVNWTIEQVVGIETVEVKGTDERRNTARAIVKLGSKVVESFVVYDYIGV